MSIYQVCVEENTLADIMVKEVLGGDDDETKLEFVQDQFLHVNQTLNGTLCVLTQPSKRGNMFVSLFHLTRNGNTSHGNELIDRRVNVALSREVAVKIPNGHLKCGLFQLEAVTDVSNAVHKD